jgi:CHAD domain-containing protein
MSASTRAIQKRWNAVMRERWKEFSRQWSRLQRRSSPGAVHKMRSASRRLASSICVAELSTGVSGERATRRLGRISDQLGPLRDNDVYRTNLDRLNTSGKVRSFSKFLSRRKSEDHRQLDQFLSRHPKRVLHQRIARIESKLQRRSKDWTDGDYRDAFEKVLRRRYEALLHSHQSWKDSPDSKGFHHMRVELRDLRYASEAVAEILGLSRTRSIQAVLKMLKSLQTTMGEIHDIHKLRMELVAWISHHPAKKRPLEMTVASALQKKLENRMVEFQDHCLASEDLLPHLQAPRRETIRATEVQNSSRS